jgi:pSer/pThr/pTyr-binding forkhead associated (FHA) protein
MISADHHSQRTADAGLAERETHGMSAGQPVVVDSYALLDHGTRAQLIAAEDAPPGRYLLIEDGDDRHLLALRRPITHIGRGLVADVRFEDPHVSRRHAIVAVRGDGVRILDDRSSTGTFVNGREVTGARLRDGDVVRLGRAVFRYVELGRDPERPADRRETAALAERGVSAYTAPAGQ